LSSGDQRRAIGTLDLIEDRVQLFQRMRADIEDYAAFIPIFREEYYYSTRKNKVAISKSLKQALEENNADQALEMMLRWLYKVRCNLIHGEKGFNDALQKKLLARSSSLLEVYLIHISEGYHQHHLSTT
jgi:hypothetical protein